MSGRLLDASAGLQDLPTSADVAIIGSGPGGATAAWLLAEAGKSVVVFEEGPDLTGDRLKQSEALLYDQLYMDRGGRATDDMAISIMQGRALGGGSVINICDVVPQHDAVLDLWHRRFGLRDFAPELLKSHNAAALADLGAAPIEEELVNKANQILRKGAMAMGWRGEVMMDNRDGCVEYGTCLLGCPADAKRNARFVALPKAMAAGAVVVCRARVTAIGNANAEIKELSISSLDEGGYRETGKFAFRAPTVILAANAIGSAQVLLRSGIGNHHVGRHLSLQPQLPLVAQFDEPVKGFIGVPQSYAVTHFELHDHPEHGLWGFRIEGVMGTPGIVSTILPYVGPEIMKGMRDYPRYAAALLLVPDRGTGRVKLRNSGHVLVTYEHAEDHRQRTREAIKAGVRCYLAAGAKKVLVPTVPPLVFTSETQLGQADALSLAPATAPFISAHQQGTVRFAPSEKDGAAAPDGRVYGTRGVYVFDSSGYPTSASSHIMAPITAISRYLTTRLLAG